ncbi:MAG: fimbria/pilus periplasmic chaperone [Rhodospirillales bacterium]
MSRELNSARMTAPRGVSGGLLGLMTAALAVSCLAFAQPAQAQGAGDLVVSPTRVVLEGRTRSAQMGLVNKGSETATYRISVINMHMGEDGNMTEVAKPVGDQQFADDLFRYSPRQVTLEPGASQAIRLLLRKPKDLPDGEYRSHMMMRAVPDNTGQSVESTGNNASVRLIPVFGIAVPIIVRHGKVSYDMSLSDMAFVPGTAEQPLPKIRFKLNRTGNRSSYGDLTATLNADGKEVVLSQIFRLAVYTPNPSRTVEMTLRVPDGVKLSGNTLKVSYKAISDEGGNLLAEGSTVLP